MGFSVPECTGLKKHNFNGTEYAALGRKAPATFLSGYTGTLDVLLKAGVTNSAVCLNRFRENGFTTERTIVKDYIAAHQHLISTVRNAVAPQGN